MRLRRSSSLALFFLLTPAISGQAQNNLSTLQPGRTIERTLGAADGGDSHSYTIKLSEKQYLQFVVNQHGIDVIVRVFSPEGKSLGEFDTPNGAEGPENVAIVAFKSGLYRIVVAPLDSNNTSEPGKYEIKTLELRDATDQELKVGNEEEARKAKGLALLNEIIDSISEIRLPQTRIRVKLDSATVLWSIDEKKATKLLTESVSDARDYLLTLKPDDETYNEVAQWVRQIRFRAVQTLAFHDPEGALNLFRATKSPPNTEADERNQEPERQFELALASQIAAKNPQRAYELAQESLKEGFSNTLTQTIQSLNRFKPELATALAKEVSAKLMDVRLMQNPEASEVLFSLLRASQGLTITTRNKTSSNPPVLSEQDFRALAQKALTEALSSSEVDGGVSRDGTGLVVNGDPVKRRFVLRGQPAEILLRTLKNILGSFLDNIVPGGTAAIDKRLSELGDTEVGRNSFEEYEKVITNASPDAAKEAIKRAPPEIRFQLMQKLAQQRMLAGDSAQANQLIGETITNPLGRRRALDDLERQAAQRAASEDRMEDALKHISNISNPESRAELISELADRIGPGRKRTAALALLETARSILGTSIQAEGQTQMRALLRLAGAFSRYDSKRGFEILEPLINQFNDLAEAARKMNGFGPQYFVDDELSMQNGNSLAQIANPLASTLGILSLVDFDRAKTSADRLHLIEVRVGVHLGIAQQAIQPKGVYSPSVAYLNILNR